MILGLVQDFEAVPDEALNRLLLASAFALALRAEVEPADVLKTVAEGVEEYEWEPIRSGIAFAQIAASFHQHEEAA